MRKTIRVVAALLIALAFAAQPALAVPPCGGTWSNPPSTTSCSFVNTAGIVAYGGIATTVPGAVAYITVEVIDASNTTVASCSSPAVPWPMTASCSNTVLLPLGPYTCKVTGHRTGFYGCIA